MEAIMMPVVVLGITGILMGLFLAYASKKFEVEVDPKVEAILAVLPGANCGACGFPGCAGYASGVALEGAKMTLCAPGGPKVIEKIGEIMGVAVEIPVKKKPVKKTVEKKVVAQTGDPISASAEFIEKNKRMLNKFKDAFDAGDKEAYKKLYGENIPESADTIFNAFIPFLDFCRAKLILLNHNVSNLEQEKLLRLVYLHLDEIFNGYSDLESLFNRYFDLMYSFSNMMPVPKYFNGSYNKNGKGTWELNKDYPSIYYNISFPLNNSVNFE